MVDRTTRQLLEAEGWLSLLPVHLREKVFDACKIRSADEGKILYHAGDPPDGLYCLLSGCLRMDTVQSAHGPTMLSLFHARSWLGEIEIFSGMDRVVTLLAHRPIKYAYISATDLEDLAKDNPEM